MKRQRHRGLTWEDMPGLGEFIKRCNFALFIRGLLSPDEIRAMAPGPVRDQLLEQLRERYRLRCKLCALQRWHEARELGLAAPGVPFGHVFKELAKFNPGKRQMHTL